MVRAYAHMGLLHDAIADAHSRSMAVATQSSVPGQLLEPDARRIGLLAEDLRKAVAELTAYAETKVKIAVQRDA